MPIIFQHNWSIICTKPQTTVDIFLYIQTTFINSNAVNLVDLYFSGPSQKTRYISLSKSSQHSLHPLSEPRYLSCLSSFNKYTRRIHLMTCCIIKRVELCMRLILVVIFKKGQVKAGRTSRTLNGSLCYQPHAQRVTRSHLPRRLRHITHISQQTLRPRSCKKRRTK